MYGGSQAKTRTASNRPAPVSRSAHAQRFQGVAKNLLTSGRGARGEEALGAQGEGGRVHTHAHTHTPAPTTHNTRKEMSLVNDSCDAKTAFSSTVDELVMKASSLLLALRPANITHANNVSCGTSLCCCHRHCTLSAVFMKQERFTLPSFLVWRRMCL